MKITIKKKLEGYTVKTPDKVAKHLTYGEMLAIVAALTAPTDVVRECEYLKRRKKKQQKFHTFDFAESVADVNEQALERLSRRLTGEELIAKGYLIPPHRHSHINQHGHNLQKYLPDGWDGVDERYSYIAIDKDGDIFAYTQKPVCFGEDDFFGEGEHRRKSDKPFAFEELGTAFIPSHINWKHLIWERPKTTQP